MQFCGRRATVMGLGRHGGGAVAARYLAEQGAIVTVTDLADAAALADSLEALAGLPIGRFHLGGHHESDFANVDLVVVNPAVRPANPLIEIARQSGAQVTSEIEMFLAACPAPVIGVTGTNGKSTTAAMTAAIINAAGRRAWLGGNIGRSLLADLPQIRPDDWIVLELSSFQLYWLGDAVRWPQVAVLTNLAPNHLDWHGSVAHYRQSKQRLLDRGRPVQPWGDADIPPLRILGRHNRANAALAAAAATLAGADRESAVRGLSEFSGLPHRLMLVAEIEGRQFFNDSKSTTPEAAIAALSAMDRPTLVLLGGSDKQVEFSPLVAAVGRQARGAALFGATGNLLDNLFSVEAPHLRRQRTERLDDALAWCWSQSSPGEAILLSPACASLDQFHDYADRGETFARLVHDIAATRIKGSENSDLRFADLKSQGPVGSLPGRHSLR
ncbi:MAG TPA: UDP-N-acetylmuramoyl-L-alanine--D-glutamate ligase [Pirellulales bacterium]|nr:UDP-N-acetylmuramoyl-L-alanine--D-glutamate ligase [Pirellulales bacterium]